MSRRAFCHVRPFFLASIVLQSVESGPWATRDPENAAR